MIHNACNVGTGKIVDIDNNKAAYVIKFNEISTLRKISFKAKLFAEDSLKER